MNKIIIPVLLVAVILASGCTNTREVTSDSSRGVTINSFTASPVQAYKGEPVIFDLEIENIGGTTAMNVQADVFGVQGQWKDSLGNAIDSTLPKWGTLTLRPPFPSRNIPGEFRIANWQVITPEIPQGITTSLPITARVTYDYNTSGHLTVKLVSMDEYRRKQSLGEQVTNAFEIVNSNGPLKMSIPERYQAPIIVDTSTSNQLETYPFRIQIDNVGDGYPITPEDDGVIRGAGGRLQGTIDLLGPGVEFDDCLGARSGTHLDLNNADILVRLREIGKGSLPLACNIKISKAVFGPTHTEDTLQFIFNIRYRYYVKQTVNVQVIGQ
ncbi:MAG: hypothetical protein AABX14_00045 [Candidatus Aenigmatarchaeota archaeon]